MSSRTSSNLKRFIKSTHLSVNNVLKTSRLNTNRLRVVDEFPTDYCTKSRSIISISSTDQAISSDSLHKVVLNANKTSTRVTTPVKSSYKKSPGSPLEVNSSGESSKTAISSVNTWKCLDNKSVLDRLRLITAPRTKESVARLSAEELRLRRISKYMQGSTSDPLSITPAANTSSRVGDILARLKHNRQQQGDSPVETSGPLSSLLNRDFDVLKRIQEVSQSSSAGVKDTGAAAAAQAVLLKKAATYNWTVTGLAGLLHESPGKVLDVARLVLDQGEQAMETSPVTLDEAEFIVEELKLPSGRLGEFRDALDVCRAAKGISVDVRRRPPIVTIMGHVNHGKTSLLDALRRGNMAAQEAGGITQKISAFSVKSTRSGELVTFIDTPGHSVFSAMRSRGASVTDIVVLVVAANDGVMPQTVEAIQHAKAANVPLVVALNKMDRDNADPRRVLEELKTHGVVAEELGGTVQTVRVSALTGAGLGDLEEELVALAELLELRASHSSEHGVRASVLEARVDSETLLSRVTAVVRQGSLKPDCFVVIGGQVGRVRSLANPEDGKLIDVAPPACPVEIVMTGLEQSPAPGSIVVAASSRKEAQRMAERFRRTEQELQMEKQRNWQEDEAALAKSLKGRKVTNARLKAILDKFEGPGGDSPVTAVGDEAEEFEDEAQAEHVDLNDFTRAIGERRADTSLLPMTVPAGKLRQVGVFLKAQQMGELEPLLAHFNSFTASLSERHVVNADFDQSLPPLALLGSSVGPLTVKEIDRVAKAGGVVLSFNQEVVPYGSAEESTMLKAGCALRKHDIIFDCFEDLRTLYDHHFGPGSTMKQQGEGVVEQVGQYTLKKKKGGKRTVVGVRVNSGSFDSQFYYRLVRNGVAVNERRVLKIQSMQKATNDRAFTSRLSTNEKAGVIMRGWDDLHEGDVLVAMEPVKRTTIWEKPEFFRNFEV